MVGQHFNEIWSRLLSRRFQSVIVELLDAVGDVGVDLSSGKSAVDSRGGFGRVAAHEVWQCILDPSGTSLFINTYCSCPEGRHCHQQGRLCGLRSGRKLRHTVSGLSTCSKGCDIRPAPTTMSLSGMMEMVCDCADEREGAARDEIVQTVSGIVNRLKAAEARSTFKGRGTVSCRRDWLLSE